MSKIELPTITSGYNLSAINNNFQKIEDALNEEVLYRKSHVGEPNEMQTNLDMNGKQILNLPNANQPSQPATYAQLLQVEAPGDSLLRNELAAPGGAGLVGFQHGSAGSAAITVEGKLRERISVNDFGGKPGFAYDSSDALIAFINAINSGEYSGSEFVIGGLYRTTKPLPAITRPVSLSGVIPANSAILFDNVTDGLSIDLSAMTSNTVHSVVSHFAILTNKTIAGTGFRYLGNNGSSQSVKLEFDSMRVDSLNRFLVNSSNQEWLIGVHIGDQAFAAKPSEVRIHNAIVYGSDLNSSYSTLTSAGSSGIVVEKSTNCIITESKIFLLSDCGIMFRGQTEGTGVYNSQVVASKQGIVYAELVNPSNNHLIDHVHISPYITGIAFQTPANPSDNTPIECYINNVFILERAENVAKSSPFIGVDAAVRFSKFVNVTVWANAKSPGLHTKIGFRIGNGGNILHNCHSHRMTYSMETFDVIPGFAHEVAVHDFHDEDSITGFLSPASTKQVAGMVRSGTLGGQTWKRPVHFMNQFTVIHENGITYFDASGGTVLNKATSGATTNYRHVPSDAVTNTPGATLIGLGGTSTANQGNWILRSALTQFSGTLTPEVANSGTVGSAGLPFAGGFTQTAYTVTSDERMKTAPLSITDEMLDAAAEVEWVRYQYLDRVEVKGSDGARWHFGAVAQRYVEAFARHGLDAHDYGFICYDEWEASPEVVNVIPAVLGENGEIIEPERTEVVRVAIEAGSRYGIRYEEVLALEAALQRRNYLRLLTRIEALEATNG